MGESNNIEELCNKVFSKPPGDPCTWCLYLDRGIAVEIPENEQAVYIFEILVQILFGGIKVLFGTNEENKISLSSITEEQFELLRKYFQMMEYDIVCDVYPIENKPNYAEYNPRDFSTVHLKFMKLIDGVAMYVDINFVPYTLQNHKPLHVQVREERNYTSNGDDHFPYF